jgi:luciferase family oxidoreductase group 1
VAAAQIAAPRDHAAMKLSVLDQSIFVEGLGEDDALRDTLALAEHAEALGYARFWVSEHHGLPTIVGTAPEVLMAAIAARTSRIRIGSAGIMLPHYAAFKVAEVFRVLDALAPGRIDLGVGRAPGGDQRTARALNPAASGMAEDFPQQVVDLMAWLDGQPHQGVLAHPRAPSPDLRRRPDLWMLGSSDYGAQLAAQLGLPYAFAYFFMDGQGVEQALHLYRSLYRPSRRHAQPQATICVWALAADSDEEAQHHALSRDRWRLDRQRGRLGPLRHPSEIAREGFHADEQAQLAAMRARAFVGSAATVAQRLRALARDLHLDELVINTWAVDPGVRRRSYALIREALGD